MATPQELFKQRVLVQQDPNLSNAEKFRQLRIIERPIPSSPSPPSAPLVDKSPTYVPTTPTYGTDYSTSSSSSGLPGSLWSQYEAKLNPLYQQQQQVLSDYLMMAAQAPTFQQKLLDEIKAAELYPSAAALREEYMANPNLTPIAIESLVSRRGQSTRGTIQDVINRAYGGFQSDVASKQAASQLAQQQIDNLLNQYGLAYQSQQDTIDRSSGLSDSSTASERYALQVKNAATADIKGWMTPKDLATKYGGILDDWELINLYNNNSPYGPMNEAPSVFKDWVSSSAETDVLDQEAVSAYAQAIIDDEISISSVPQAYRAGVLQLVEQMRTSQDTSSDGGLLGRLLNWVF